MTAVVAVIVLLALALALTMLKLLQTLHRLGTLESKAHAKCIAHIAHYVGDEFAAQVLEAAAEDYDTALGRQQLGRITVSERMEGESIPARWMRLRAQGMKRTPAPELDTPQYDYDRSGA